MPLWLLVWIGVLDAHDVLISYRAIFRGRRLALFVLRTFPSCPFRNGAASEQLTFGMPVGTWQTAPAWRAATLIFARSTETYK